jgi:SAM-dependent methyltransferase
VSKIYNKFATVYDLMGADRHSLRMCDYTLELFKKFKITPRSGLEICCGTGSALKFFADHGYSMAGLDQSAQMLAQTRKKLGKSAPLVQATLPQFRIPDRANSRRLRQFDFAYSYYDSLNYLLKPADLQATFVNVRKHLSPGGWFIFDMNSPQALRGIWGNNVWGGAHENLCWIFRHTYDDANTLGTVRTTFFIREGKLWRRFDETHVERGYSLKVFRQLLKKSGFDVKAIYRCFTFYRATDNTNRICVVARKSPL